MNLSRKAKEAIKTALAMSIAYGIALSMDWENPYWAGFAVAFISLATIGQSVNKGAMRMLGTLVASAVALVFIGLFAQERWLFMVCLSAWVGFCTYMMGGSKRQYFWNVCGFVCVIICIDAGPDAVDAFYTAVLRAEETGLGILVYSLVAILLWPSNSRTEFDGAADKLISAQRRLYVSYLGLMSAEGDEEAIQALRATANQAHARFAQLLDAAESDTYEVWELRHQWRRYQQEATKLAEAMERWREGFAEIRTLQVPHLLPSLTDFGTELDQRLAQVERMLNNSAPEIDPHGVTLEINRDAVHALPHFQRAALQVTRTELHELERLTRSMFEHVADIRGFRDAVAEVDDTRKAGHGFWPDPDRLAAVARVLATMWAAYLMVIYIGDFPGGFGFVTMASVFGMITANIPHVRLWDLFAPAATSTLFGGLIYIFVMPQLWSFLGLGTLIFVVTFAICYLFAAPRQALGRTFGLAMFVTVAAVSNEQTYNFLSVANTALMFPLVFLLLAATVHIPYSRRPEHAFLRQLGRFFASCAYLTSPPRGVGRWGTSFHRREITTLPAKLGVCAGNIDRKLLPGEPAQSVQDMVTDLQTVARRVQILIDARGAHQAEPLVTALAKDLQAWRRGVEESCRRLSDDPASGDSEAFRTALARITQGLEERIEITLDDVPDGQLTAADGENFYRLLGAFRGLSEALVDYVEHAGTIDWALWREERFA